MNRLFVLTFLMTFSSAGAGFAASETPATPVVPEAPEATVEDTTPATTYGPGCPYDGYEDASTEEAVS